MPRKVLSTGVNSFGRQISRCPTTSLGDAVNDFRTIPYEFDTVHDMVFLSALNPSPAHARFLQSRGLTSEEIDRQGYCGVAYQAVMRTSLRDATDSTPKTSLYLMSGSLCISVTCYRAQSSRRWILVSLTKRIKAADLGSIRIMLKKCGAGGRTKRKKRAALLAEVFTPKKPQDASSEGYSSSKTDAP